jgi:hypothetical protein
LGELPSFLRQPSSVRIVIDVSFLFLDIQQCSAQTMKGVASELGELLARRTFLANVLEL